jgi:transcriptional regulator with XRE-family HTH domain
MNPTSRADLAAFLRARRARLSPRQAGLPLTGQRRTPGLRRQEVAQLAGLSVDYYIRLEQARGPHPSRQVLSALARALMLTADERDYLFRVAGESPPPVPQPMLKHVNHPLTGPLEFECQVLHIAETGQRLIAYCAAPGSATAAAFRDLAARAPLPA